MTKEEQSRARAQDELRLIAPYLTRIDMDSLKKIEQLFQAEQHRALFGLLLNEGEKVLEIHSRIRSVHQFIEWIDGKLRKATTINAEG